MNPVSALRPEVADKRLFVLDMDGTIYLGDELFPWTRPFLDAVSRAGAHYLFLTNNSSRTAAEYVEKLLRLGVAATPQNVLTSGDATIELLRHEGRWQRLFVLAPPAVVASFEEAGFVMDEERPQALVMAYDTTLHYRRLVRFCLHARTGLPYIATHPDFNCPTPAGPIPDTGAFMALVEASTGRPPDRVVGKPQPDILLAGMKRFGVTEHETVMVGDRLYTDIACGLAAGVDSVLVLSGESTPGMVAESPHQPTRVVANLGALIAD